jgi:hypothetical protein
MTKTPSTTTDRIESARKILNAPASTLPELEAALAVLQHVLAETDAEAQEMASANWRRLNGSTIEADPPRAQLAAE